jgi:hypothetical protein
MANHRRSQVQTPLITKLFNGAKKKKFSTPTLEDGMPNVFGFSAAAKRAKDNKSNRSHRQHSHRSGKTPNYMQYRQVTKKKSSN